MHDARITHFAILITPIWVVVVVSPRGFVVLIGEIICLLCECRWLTTASRCTKGDEWEAFVFSPLLLGCQEIAHRRVGDTFTNLTFYINVWGITPCHLCSECPSILHKSARVGGTSSTFVVAVGTCETHFPTLCIVGSRLEIIGSQTNRTKGKIVGFNTLNYLFVTGSIVETTHSREVELSTLGGVEGDTLDIVLLINLLVSTTTIACVGPSVGDGRVEHILACTGCRCHGLALTFVVVEIHLWEVENNFFAEFRHNVVLQSNISQIVDLVLQELYEDNIR